MADSENASISITLSPTQVDAVVRAASHGNAPGISRLITESLNAPVHNGRHDASGSAGAFNGMIPTRGYLPNETADPRLSRSLVRGLSLLTGFGPDGDQRG